MRILLALMLAAPLSAQQQSTTLVPDVNVTLPPLEVFNNITVMSDSAMIANLAENNRLLREMLLAEREECNTCAGASLTTTVVRVGRDAAFVLFAFLAVRYLKGIRDKPDGDDIHNEGDTNVEVVVPPHEHESSEPDHESGNG